MVLPNTCCVLYELLISARWAWQQLNKTWGVNFWRNRHKRCRKCAKIRENSRFLFKGVFRLDLPFDRAYFNSISLGIRRILIEFYRGVRRIFLHVPVPPYHTFFNGIALMLYWSQAGKTSMTRSGILSHKR